MERIKRSDESATMIELLKRKEFNADYRQTDLLSLITLTAGDQTKATPFLGACTLFQNRGRGVYFFRVI